MDSIYNYNDRFDYAYDYIRSEEEPHPLQGVEDIDQDFKQLRKTVIFDFGFQKLNRYGLFLQSALNYSVRTLQLIISDLINQYGLSAEVIEAHGFYRENTSPILFVVKDDEKDELLLFKQIENDLIVDTDKSLFVELPYEVKKFFGGYTPTSFKYIYLVLGDAYKQVFQPDRFVTYSEFDQGHGTNFYSLKWFFCTYFGEEEYSRFYKALNLYNNKINKFLLCDFVKPLAPDAKVDFNYNIEKELIRHDYTSVESLKRKGITIKENEFKKIRAQFINRRLYRVLVGASDFAESFITAEWLYDSMKRAYAVDLTFIGSGYFKAVEQLLYALLRIDNPKYYIKANIDTSLGGMADQYRDYFHSFRNDLDGKESGKKTWFYVKETIYAYKKIRNGYFHKNNIHEWSKIDEIREATYQIMFLLLGTQSLIGTDIVKLGAPDDDYYTDYYKLCEYVNYHSGELFLLTFENGKQWILVALNDIYMTNNGSYKNFTGAYFRKQDDKTARQRFCLTEENMPKKIIRLRVDLYPNEENSKTIDVYGHRIPYKYVKVEDVFDNGSYVGPSIVEEISGY